MNILPIIDESTSELEALFQAFHADPEIGFQEVRTSKTVVAKLAEYGVDEVHEGIGGTGVVALIRGSGNGNRRIGLRADMDALPIHEASAVDFASTNDGVMHACGHDGHTTMLLGAAKHLAATRDFAGTAVLIFQPAEEGLGGARRMIAEGLFDRFPCDEVYGLHNDPNGQAGRFAMCKGPALAGAAFFDISVRGIGCHAALPEEGRDALMVAASLATEMNTIVARNISPHEKCVLSITQLNSGSAYNVVPGTATLAGTVRYFSDEVYAVIARRMKAICAGFAQSHQVEIDLDLRNVFEVLVNDDELSDAYLEAARDIVGDAMAHDDEGQTLGSEDFSDMLKVVPGAYCNLGHSGTIPLHNPAFVLGQEILPIGASIIARLVERRLPL